MPCVVLLIGSNELKIVKSSWCENMKKAASKNSGIHPSEKIKIFYSPVTADKPDFRLKTRKVFNVTRAACYIGFVLYICGK